MAASKSSTLTPTIPQMIQSLSELHRQLSHLLKPSATVLPAPAVAETDAGGDQIEEETRNHQAETTASKEATEDHQTETNDGTKAAQLRKLMVNIEHLKGALEETNELDRKLNEPIQRIKASLEEVIKRNGSSPGTDFVEAICKDMKTLKFQIPSFKKFSLAGTTAHLSDGGLAAAEQNQFKLPNLFGHKVFDESPAYKEIEVIYKGFDDVCKKGFLYFAVFPENVVFKKRFLTYWWIGERLFEDHETPEDCTGMILEKFAEKGLIVPVKEDQKMVKKKFRMPPIVRSAAIKLAIDSKFLDYDKGNNPIAKYPRCDRIFLVKGAGSDSPKVPTALPEQKSKEGTKSIFNVRQPFSDSALKWLPKVLTGRKVPVAPTDAKVPAGMTAPLNAKAPTGAMDLTNATVPADMTAPMNANTPMVATELIDAKVPAGMMEPTDMKTSTGMPTNMAALTDQKLQEEIKSIFNVSQPFPDSALEWLAKKGVVDMRTVKAVEWLLKLTNLEVLYLGRWQSAVDEQQIEVESYGFLKGLKKMKKLRLLSLQGISWINKLPNSLRTLSELRVLDLKSCFNLEKLPQGIGSLKNLTHLDVSGCYMLNEMPKSISKLTELTVLKGFISGRSNLTDLIGLKKLRKLSINISRLNFPDEMDLDVLQVLGEHNLRSLTIVWGSGGVKQDEVKKEPSLGEGAIQPSAGGGVEEPSSREVVEEPSLGEGGKEPSSSKRNMIRQLTKKLLPKEPEKLEVQCLPKELVKLEVQCLPKKEIPQWLNPSNLKSLKRLYIRGGKLGELGNEPWSAEVVRLKYMTNLKIEWRELRKCFPNLRYLQKVRCPKVTFCPCDANGVWMQPL